MRLSGRATRPGTERFAARCTDAAPGHFRQASDWTASSIGLGTYLGDDTEGVDRGYAAAITRALELGCNVLDTAINYRNQRSERVVGQTLATLIADGRVRRDEVVVASKGGFLPFDSSYAGSMRAYIEDTFLKPRIITAADIVAGCHCMTPGYLRHQLETSRRNLGCQCIDVYYLHNPETQLQEVGHAEFLRRIQAAFAVLEEAVGQGRIGVYGTATWNGYRVRPESPDYLSLSELVACAHAVAGDGHHFRAIQLPFNLAMPEAFTLPNQAVRNERLPLLRAAREWGFTVMASASLLQARLTRNLSERIRTLLNGGLEKDAQRALQFVRSAPGMTTALVGISDPAHAEENLALRRALPVPEERFARA